METKYIASMNNKITQVIIINNFRQIEEIIRVVINN